MSSGGASSGAATASSGCSRAGSTTGSSTRSPKPGSCGPGRTCQPRWAAARRRPLRAVQPPRIDQLIDQRLDDAPAGLVVQVAQVAGDDLDVLVDHAAV